MKRVGLAVFLCMLMLASTSSQTQFLNQPSMQETSGRATGVDLTVDSINIFYPDSTNSTKYRMFSSNYPIASFNRPQSLFAIDAVLNVESQIDITIENLGTSSSGVVTVTAKLLHNEYSYFEIASVSTQVSQISGGSQGVASVKITPTYSGNHTLEISVSPTIADDDPSNNDFSRFFTVAYSYFNCDTLLGWTAGSSWNLNTDTSISMGTSCHVGNGEGSTYPNNLQSSLVFPAMNLSDAHPNPLRTNGFSFYYTGSLAPNDTIKMQALSNLGAWNDIGTLQGTVDNSFIDGASWLTFSLADKGASSPIVPVASQYFHQNSQFRFLFESDASGNDIGFWFDEIVIVYDQKVRQTEYGVSARSVSSVPSLPGEWGSVRIEVTNTGNISELFIPEVKNLPQDWEIYYARTSGTSFDPMDGVLVTPGQPHEFDIKFKPDVNTSIGFKSMQLELNSKQYTSIGTSVNFQFQVMADRVPIIHPKSPKPSCPPTYTCPFEMSVENIGDATDVFDMVIDTSQLPLNWNVQFDWNQPTSVQLRPNQPKNVAFLLTIPGDAIPDTMSEFTFSLTSQNDSRRMTSSIIDVSASMMSDASVDVSNEFIDGIHYVDPGETLTISYTIWNNASRQDIFDISVLSENVGQWIVHQPSRTNAVLNAGTSTSFDVIIEAPVNAQGGDRGPTITPVLQSQRSFMEIHGHDFDRLRVNTFYDIKIEGLELPQKLTPGQSNEIPLQITNLGNGESSANITLPNLPESWSWWLANKEGIPIDENIELTAPYDLGDIMQFSIWLHLPNDEGAGEFHTIEVAATSTLGQDLNDVDNHIEFTIITSSIRLPMLTSGNQSNEVESGGFGFAESTLSNLGNAVDDRLSVKASISVHPPNDNIVAFFTINGGDREINQEIPVQLLHNQPLLLNTDLLLPEDLALNSRIVISYEVTGAIDENGLPYTMKTEAMMMVTKKRTLDFNIEQKTNDTTSHNMASPFYVNISSSSSESESILLDIEYPEQWQVICQKVLFKEPLEFNLQPGVTIEQQQIIDCEVRRFGGLTEGDVRITVSTLDEFRSQTTSLTFVFEEEPQSDKFLATDIALIGAGGLLALLSLLFLLRRRSTELNVEEELQTHQQTGPPIQYYEQQQQEVQEKVNDQPIVLADTTVQETINQVVQHRGPPLPPEGLPVGWTMEQWQYYGQQYLDGTL